MLFRGLQRNSTDTREQQFYAYCTTPGAPHPCITSTLGSSSGSCIIITGGRYAMFIFINHSLGVVVHILRQVLGDQTTAGRQTCDMRYVRGPSLGAAASRGLAARHRSTSAHLASPPTQLYRDTTEPAGGRRPACSISLGVGINSWSAVGWLFGI